MPNSVTTMDSMIKIIITRICLDAELEPPGQLKFGIDGLRIRDRTLFLEYLSRRCQMDDVEVDARYG
jgi:hypothetical protein